MAQKPWFTANVHAPGTGIALGLIGLSLLPVGLLALIQVSCFVRPPAFRNEYGGGNIPEALSVSRINMCMGGGG